jgi:SAM-dependent methyltransferase
MGGGAKKAWDERARAILQALPIAPRSVLDVGAGEGHLVRALREMGIAAEGIETSPAGRAAARRLYDLELGAGIAGAAERRFQLITFIHSLEHVADPVGALAQLASFLEPAGLVFIEVPHAGSIDVWRPRRRAEILDLPAHLYHFEPATLSRIVERAGLRVVDLFLSNPDVVEWVVRMRARSRGGASNERPVTTGPTGSVSPSSSRAGVVRSLWAGRLLPWIRRRFPGGKLQLLAARSA